VSGAASTAFTSRINSSDRNQQIVPFAVEIGLVDFDPHHLRIAEEPGG